MGLGGVEGELISATSQEHQKDETKDDHEENKNSVIEKRAK